MAPIDIYLWYNTFWRKAEEEREFMQARYFPLIFREFEAGLNQEKYLQRLQLAYENESQSRPILYRLSKEFHRILIFFIMKNSQEDLCQLYS